jgi:hypothetical protein
MQNLLTGTDVSKKPAASIPGRQNLSVWNAISAQDWHYQFSYLKSPAFSTDIHFFGETYSRNYTNFKG